MWATPKELNGGIKMETEIIRAKRGLGDGHWDRKLMANMVELSNADNYEEAKEEWIATGEVWHRRPDTLNEEVPSWVNDHEGKCLCGHRVVYHFKIRNTENGNEECVGSEHIGSYLILREIKERTGLDDADITDEMIQKWIDEKTQSMIATAWWDNNGEHITQMFDKIKEADLRINVKSKDQYWCWTDKKYKIRSRMLKRGSGKMGDDDYQMSSIVWRWNHPHNPKNQQITRGYPNDKLWSDLIYFHAMYDLKHKARLEREDARLAELTKKHLEQIAYNKKLQEERQARFEERQRIEREERARIEEERKAKEAERKAQAKINNADILLQDRKTLNDLSMFNNSEISEFKNMCDYYGLPVFDGNYPISVWESGFLIDLRNRLAKGNDLTPKQLSRLKSICTNEPATSKQVEYLKSLGYEDVLNITKRKASILISNKNNYGTFDGEQQ